MQLKFLKLIALLFKYKKYSDNDPYVKFEVEQDFANLIFIKQYIVENASHINTESVYTKFKRILESID